MFYGGLNSMKIIAKMHLAFNRAIEAVGNKRGQNTIEYLFMLGIIVAVVGLVGVAIKKFMPDLFQTIQDKIMGQASSL